MEAKIFAGAFQQQHQGVQMPIKKCAQLIFESVIFAVSFLLILCFLAFDCSWWSLYRCCHGESIMKLSFPWGPSIRMSAFCLKLLLRHDGQVMFLLQISGSTFWKTVTQKFYFLQAYREDMCWIYGFPLDGWCFKDGFWMTALSTHLNDSSATCVNVTATSWPQILPATHCDKVMRDRKVEKSLSCVQASGNYWMDPSGSEPFFVLDLRNTWMWYPGSV